jgi:hydroxymethylpyrimidine pyrophosphatase-like HAD family hydrolase
VCTPLDPRIVQEILRLTWAAGAWGECYTGGQSFTPAKDIPTIRAFMRDRDFVYLDRQPVEDLPAWAAENAHRIVKLNLMFRDGESRERVRRQLADRTDLLLTSASDHNLEVNAPTGGKGDALRALGEKLGIVPAQIMACGDQLNDITMLRAVGFPVAMGNAVPEIKAAAAFVTRTNEEDGVAYAVERFVLGHPVE